MLPSEIPKLPTDLLVTVFPAVWELLLLHDCPPPGRVSVPNSFVSFVCLFIYFVLPPFEENSFVCLFIYFVLPPFEENELPFWVPDVLCQHSEVFFFLWNLLGIQMFF